VQNVVPQARRSPHGSRGIDLGSGRPQCLPSSRPYPEPRRYGSHPRPVNAYHQCLNYLLRRAEEMAAMATRGAVRFPRRVAE
jgi:hypothetical protein